LEWLDQVEPHLYRILWRYDKTKCLEYISRKTLSRLRGRVERFRWRHQTRLREVAARLAKGEITPKVAISTLSGKGHVP
jgi:hypothetical protein